MKKIIVFLIIMALTLTLNIKNVKAEEKVDEPVYYTLLESSLKNGGKIAIQRENENFTYRTVLNDKTAMTIDFGGMNIGWVKFMESSSYYLFFGSLMDDFNVTKTYPYILRINKDFSNYKLYKNMDVSGPAYCLSLLEFSSGKFIVTEFVEGRFSFGMYLGYYRLFSMDDDLNVLSSIDIGDKECDLSIAYDVIEIKRTDKTITYFDREFNIVSDYDREVTEYGTFELLAPSLVNGISYDIGASFNTPGEYILNDGLHEERIVHLYPEIKGVKEGEEYDDYIAYQISGGNIYVNGNPAYLNGTIAEVGSYTITIKGLGDFEEIVNFKILPALISSIETGDSLDIGDEILFTGKATLNGDEIESGYTILNAGAYELCLYSDGIIEKTVYFSVAEEEVKENSKVWVYIVEGLAVVSLGVTCFFIFRRKKVKKATK
ncbi:MAG: hypothetical protein H6687_02945 [Bacillales bacterium]|nr:hypothetical protein [Bacillales bacterium]